MALLTNRMNTKILWNVATTVEVVIAAAVIIRDVSIPTIVILGMIVVSLLVRREGIASLGFTKNTGFMRMASFVFISVFLWQLFQIGVTMPVLNHLTGTTQDLSAFSNLKGNLGKLLMYLALTWTLAAFGEEIVYRGYLQRRLGELLGTNLIGWIVVIGVSSLLFGIAHTEQGLIGVIVTSLDAIVFSLLKVKFDKNLWAAVLAHGLSNSIGLITFFFVGPIYGLW